MKVVFYVSSEGNDEWSGLLNQPSKEGIDGPFKTFSMALNRARRYRRLGEGTEAEIHLLGGSYRVVDPIRLTEEDSNLVIKGIGEKQSIFHGVTQIKNWSEMVLKGRRAWKAPLPLEFQKESSLQDLFVNGERRVRSTSLKEGWHQFLTVSDLDLSEPVNASTLFQGSKVVGMPPEIDLSQEKNLTDIEILVSHYWVQERLPIQSYDPVRREATVECYSLIQLRNDNKHEFARFRLENLWSAFENPGEWYADRSENVIYYFPFESEKINEALIEIPKASVLFRIFGSPEKLVQNIIFENLHFYGTNLPENLNFYQWYNPDPLLESNRFREASRMFFEVNTISRHREYGASPQAAFELPGMIDAAFAQKIEIKNCQFSNSGGYAIVSGEGCRSFIIQGNQFKDLGGGAVLCDGGKSDQTLNGFHRISDNIMTRTGVRRPAAVAILLMLSRGNKVFRNKIEKTSYSAISSGWSWGVDATVTRDNCIEENQIKEVGAFGGLNDMAGIYCVGIQPGTRIVRNHIQEVNTVTYGGGGIYLDEGGSQIHVEGNEIHGKCDYGILLHKSRQNYFFDNQIHVQCRLAGIVLAGGMNEERAVTYPDFKQYFVRNHFIIPGSVPCILDESHRFEENAVYLQGNEFLDTEGLAHPLTTLSQPAPHLKKK